MGSVPIRRSEGVPPSSVAPVRAVTTTSKVFYICPNLFSKVLDMNPIRDLSLRRSLCLKSCRKFHLSFAWMGFIEAIW